MDIRPLGSGAQTGNVPAQPSPVPAAQALPDTAAAQQSGAVPASQAEPSVDQVEQAVQKINASLASQSQGIEFSIDNTSHRIVVKVVDQSNNEVIRQIPSKEALAIADSLDDSQGGQSQGLLIKQQA
jgi:flagellar protein FlaG